MNSERCLAVTMAKHRQTQHFLDLRKICQPLGSEITHYGALFKQCRNWKTIVLKYRSYTIFLHFCIHIILKKDQEMCRFIIVFHLSRTCDSKIVHVVMFTI